MLYQQLSITFLAIAEVYKNEGNDEYRKKRFSNAIYSYTEGIKVNCKDNELKAKLYSNRAIAHFYLGKKPCIVLSTVNSPLTDNLVRGQFHLRTPFQIPILPPSQTLYLHIPISGHSLVRGRGHFRIHNYHPLINSPVNGHPPYFSILWCPLMGMVLVSGQLY